LTLLVLFAGLSWLAVGPSTTTLGLDLSEPALKVVVMGDQGSSQIRQWSVARALEARLSQLGGANFVLLAGDNFYGRGVTSVDDLQWRYAFENVYQGDNLRGLPFYAVLGNHDVRGNVDAQIEYGRTNAGSNRWHMPARNYFVDFGQTACRNQPLVRIIFLDTTESSSTLSEEAEFLAASAQSSQALWKIVIAHHPVRNYGSHGESEGMQSTILPALLAARIDLYISGHEHNQQVIQRPGEPTFLISGAGGKPTYPLQDTHGEFLRGYSVENGYSILVFDESTFYIDMYGLNDEPLQRFELNPPNSLKLNCA
jgi:hypothetical protein